MGKKKKDDSFYYDNFNDCAEYACKAAKLLDDVLHNFDPERIDDAVKEMHEIEQAADEKNHEVSDALLNAFITPIEREDIDTLSDALDIVVDRIEGVLHRVYFCNIQEIRPGALEMSAKVVTACEEMRELVHDLPQFKRNKSMRKRIIAVNAIEEEVDNLYIGNMRELHTTETDPIQVIAWRDVYTFLEFCADAAEHVAGVVDAIVMKNS